MNNPTGVIKHHKPHIEYKGKKYTMVGLSQHKHCMLSRTALKDNMIQMKYALRVKREDSIKLQGGIPPKDIEITLTNTQIKICMNKGCAEYIADKITKRKKRGKVVAKAEIDWDELGFTWFINRYWKAGSLAHTVR